jgi:hemolysin activation/secretion protein
MPHFLQNQLMNALLNRGFSRRLRPGLIGGGLAWALGGVLAAGFACAADAPAPSAAPAAAPTPANASVAPAGLPKFDIEEFRVEGNSLLDAAAIEQAVQAHMGEGRTIKDVEAARLALENRYHDAGYLTVLVAIPEQNVDTGVVNLQVVEVPVAKLRVVGAQYHLPSVIEKRLSQVAEGKVPNFAEFQKSLTEVNRAADIKVAPVLKPGKVPGTVDVQLDVDDQLPLHGSVEMKSFNRRRVGASPDLFTASVRYDNLWQRGHSIGLTLQMAPQHVLNTVESQKMASINYLWPVGTAGDAVSLYAVSSSNLSPSGNDPVQGDTQIAGVRYALVLDGSADYMQNLTVGLDYKDVKQSLSLLGYALPRTRYTPLSLAYRGVWLNAQPQPTTLDISATMGVRGLLSDPDASQQYDTNFTVLRSALQTYRDVGRWSLASKLELQLGSGALPSSEKFGIGGADRVRGYRDGEYSADRAMLISFELSSPAWKVPVYRADWRAKGVTFVEGAAFQTSVRPGETTSVAGAGAGLRLTGPRGIGMQLDAARALKDGNVAKNGWAGDDGTAKGKWGLYARVSMEF